jgi:CRP-like cAMP-binding protein
MKKVLYLFGQLSDADVEWLINHAGKQHVPAGAVLIRECQPIDTLYIVLAGVLEVASTALGANRVRLGSGEVVGEMSFIESRLPSASVTAVEDSTVLAVPRPQLQAKLDSDLGFAARFYRALAMFLSHRLRTTVGRFGAGPGRPGEEDAEDGEELDPQLLDAVHMAGCRFDHVLQRLLVE